MKPSASLLQPSLSILHGLVSSVECALDLSTTLGIQSLFHRLCLPSSAMSRLPPGSAHQSKTLQRAQTSLRMSAVHCWIRFTACHRPLPTPERGLRHRHGVLHVDGVAIPWPPRQHRQRCRGPRLGAAGARRLSRDRTPSRSRGVRTTWSHGPAGGMSEGQVHVLHRDPSCRWPFRQCCST